MTGLPADTAVARFLRGASDLVELPDPISDPDGPLARRYTSAAGANRPRYYRTTLEQTRFVALNARHGISSDRHLRQAVGYALNRALFAGGCGGTMDGLPSTGRLDPSGQLLPPNVGDYRRGTPYPLRADTPRARELAGGRRGVAVMALPRGCGQCARSVGLARAALVPLGIDVRARPVRSLTAVRNDPGDVDLFDGNTPLEYPDPASFLDRMLGHDVPRASLPQATRSGVHRLSRFSGDARDAAAVKLAARVESRDVPVVAIGHPVIGQLFSPRLGCLLFPGSRPGVDLSALCRR